MTSPASSSHLRLLSPPSEEVRVKSVVPGACFQPAEPTLPGYRSGIRDIDTRESWGSTPEGTPSPRWVRGVKLVHPNQHEPTANFIILVSSLLMFAAAVWWGSTQGQHDVLPLPENAAEAASEGTAPRQP